MIRLLLLRMPKWLELAWLGAPLNPGPTGELALLRYRAWKPEAVFVIIDTFIDESGTHGSSPHLIMGGIVGRLGQWAEFDKLWRKMLRQEGIEYYHTKSMKSEHGPFKGWRPERKSALVKRIGKIKEKASLFGFSIKVIKSEYVEHYNDGTTKLKKYQWDTMYGLCFRYCALHVAQVVQKTFAKKDLTLNFVLEDGAKNFGQAKKIFEELKKEDAFKHIFGEMMSGGKKKYPGLQGADFVSHTTFLAEQDQDMDLTDFPAEGNLGDARKLLRRKSPDFRCHIGSELLKDWRQRMLTMEKQRLEFWRQNRATAALPPAAAE